MQNLKEVLDAVYAVGLHLTPKKCSLFNREVEFLGHIVGAGVLCGRLGEPGTVLPVVKGLVWRGGH